MPTVYSTKLDYQKKVKQNFTEIFGMEPHENSSVCYETNVCRWKEAVEFIFFTFGLEPDHEEFETFMEQITGNYGRPDPVESILAHYYGLTEEIMNTILAAIDA